MRPIREMRANTVLSATRCIQINKVAGVQKVAARHLKPSAARLWERSGIDVVATDDTRPVQKVKE
jgi:hypothetical protein